MPNLLAYGVYDIPVSTLYTPVDNNQCAVQRCIKPATQFRSETSNRSFSPIPVLMSVGDFYTSDMLIVRIPFVPNHHFHRYQQGCLLRKNLDLRKRLTLDDASQLRKRRM